MPPGRENGPAKEKGVKFTCLFCQKICKTQFYLEQHMGVHTGERPYQCNLCEENFTFHSGVWRHCVKKHGGRGGEYETCTKLPENVEEVEEVPGFVEINIQNVTNPPPVLVDLTEEETPVEVITVSSEGEDSGMEMEILDEPPVQESPSPECVAIEPEPVTDTQLTSTSKTKDNQKSHGSKSQTTLKRFFNLKPKTAVVTHTTKLAKLETVTPANFGHPCFFCKAILINKDELWWHVKDNHRIRYNIYRATIQPTLPAL